MKRKQQLAKLKKVVAETKFKRMELLHENY